MFYSIYAWGASSLLTIVCFVADRIDSLQPELKPGFGVSSCWFSENLAKAIYFFIPLGITCAVNICLFIMTALKIQHHKKHTTAYLKSSESRRHDDNKQWFNLYLKLFIVMGISWTMEVISWYFSTYHKVHQMWWIIFDLANTLQGVVIFIIFVCKRKIKRLLLRRFEWLGNGILSRDSTRNNGSYPTSSSLRTCTTVTPLQEKPNGHQVTRGKLTSTATESLESDCV